MVVMVWLIFLFQIYQTFDFLHLPHSSLHSWSAMPSSMEESTCVSSATKASPAADLWAVTWGPTSPPPPWQRLRWRIQLRRRLLQVGMDWERRGRSLGDSSSPISLTTSLLILMQPLIPTIRAGFVKSVVMGFILRRYCYRSVIKVVEILPSFPN